MAISEVLSVVGAVTGSMSLSWNVASYLLAGARASVEVGTGFSQRGALFISPVSKEGINVYDNPVGGSADSALVIQVRSKGRQGLTVDAVKLVGRKGKSYMPTRFLEGAPPARLDVYASHTMTLRLNEVNVNMHNALRQESVSEIRLRAVVLLGNGKVKKSKPIRFYVGDDPNVIVRSGASGESPDHDDK